MFRRILTAEERTAIKRYLAKDGEKAQPIRMLVNRARSNMPAIKSDLALLEALLETYSK